MFLEVALVVIAVVITALFLGVAIILPTRSVVVWLLVGGMGGLSFMLALATATDIVMFMSTELRLWDFLFDRTVATTVARVEQGVFVLFTLLSIGLGCWIAVAATANRRSVPPVAGV